ncbi:antimicrobial peptide microplusin-like isoform X2 [Amblyomma americanum]
MKAFLVFALLDTFAALSCADHLELCDKTDEQLKFEVLCIRLIISTAERAMAKYFTRAQITELRNASAACGFNLTSDERSS